MKRRSCIFVILALAVFSGYAQDARMNELIELVRGLKSGGQKAFDAAAEKMSTDLTWTPMNELKASDPKAECRASDRVPGFKLNKMLAAAEQKRRFEASTGNMLNGENPNFNYSLYERGIKPMSTLEYTLKGRSGAQCIVLMPYDGLKASDLEVSVSCGGKTLEKTCTKDAFIFTGKAPQGQPLKITIKNTGDKARSFAILNYNSRK
ncbi:MAG: hypothetical protein K2L96_05140 [Muribaculaceae bacterium]|nr:hypothetical protein [Muribaculaceae bacterium]